MSFVPSNQSIFINNVKKANRFLIKIKNKMTYTNMRKMMTRFHKPIKIRKYRKFNRNSTTFSPTNIKLNNLKIRLFHFNMFFNHLFFLNIYNFHHWAIALKENFPVMLFLICKYLLSLLSWHYATPYTKQYSVEIIFAIYKKKR